VLSISSLESFLFPLWYNFYEEVLRYLYRIVSRSRTSPRHVGATGTPIICRPFKLIFYKLLRIRTDSTNFFLRGHVPKLRIIFLQIISRANEDFEQQIRSRNCWRHSSLIVTYYIYYIVYYIQMNVAECDMEENRK